MFHIKSRPLVFSDVVGQPVTKRILAAVAASNGSKLDNAYLLPGPHGVGKTTLARIFSRALLCHQPQEDGNPCNTCRSCLAHLADTHTGYKEIDAANNGGKEDVAAILNSLSFESEGGRTVVLLDECHAISKAGKDALLKILETKSDGSFVFIFCTTEPNSVPPALWSRSTVLPIRLLSVEETVSKLTRICESEGLTAERGALTDIAVNVGGHLRDAEQLLRVASLLSSSITALEIQEAGVPSLVDISKALILLPRDPDRALSEFDRITGYSGSREVYESILHLLVEASRYGLSLERYDAIPPARELYKAFPRKIQPILDYILTKQRLDDPYLLRADLVVLHARYLIGDIPDISIEQPVAAAKQQMPMAASAPSVQKSRDPVKAAQAQRAILARERDARMGAISFAKNEKPMQSFEEETTNAKPPGLSRD